MPPDSDDREPLFSRYGRRFEAGTILYQDGEAAKLTFLLLEGRVRLFKQVGALERSLRVVRRGEVFGESGLLAPSEYGATAIALDDGAALAFDRAALSGLLSDAPELGAELVHQLARRLRDAEDQVEVLLMRDAQSKVVVALLKLARQHFGAEPSATAFEISPLELSARVGLDVDSVKRIVLALRESGYVRIQDERLEVPDAEALRELFNLLSVKDQLRGAGAREPARSR
jgi:CRP-like cAMP-binding protein